MLLTLENGKNSVMEYHVMIGITVLGFSRNCKYRTSRKHLDFSIAAEEVKIK